MGEGKNGRSTDRTALIGLLGIIAGAIVVTIYYFVSVWYCNQRREGGPSSGREGPETSQEDMPTSTSYSMAQLLPVFRYAKESEGDTCAVCLCEFKKSEDVRVLPECLHLFHVSCIDAWLNAHSNCPLCRANTLPPLNLALSLPNPGGIPLTGSPQPTRL